MNAPRVLITRRIAPPADELLAAAGFRVDVIDQEDPPPRPALLQRVAGAAGIVAMLSEKIDGELLDAAGPALKVVANYAVGIDNLDLAACRARGVRATNTPGVLTDATADIAWALLLAVARRVVEGDQLVRTGAWGGWRPLQLVGAPLTGMTLGILGAGRIGAAVALRSAGFRMHVLYTSNHDNAELNEKLGARRVSLDELLPQVDFLSIHTPLTPATRHLLGAAQLARLKPTAIVINTARGPVVDEAALVAALRAGRLAGAGFDVYEHEPRLSPGLAELPNVVLLPHLGSANTATRARMAEMAAQNVIAVLQGREPPNAVA